MNRESLLRSPLPIDRVAARVVFGKSEHWTPEICRNEPVFFAPPEMRTAEEMAVIKRNPDFVDFSGRLLGDLRVIGMAAKTKTGKMARARWVMRCSCGNYVLRSASAIANQGPSNRCPRCTAKFKLRGVWDDGASPEEKASE